MAFLKVDQQQVWYEEYGNKDGIAIVMLHGGPGGKSKKDSLAMYNQTKYRLIQIDQRGSTWGQIVEEIGNYFLLVTTPPPHQNLIRALSY